MESCQKVVTSELVISFPLAVNLPLSDSVLLAHRKCIGPQKLCTNPRHNYLLHSHAEIVKLPSVVFCFKCFKCGNPILKFVRNVPWEFGEIIPDYQLSSTSCALYLR